MERYRILKELLRDTALLTGDPFFQAAVRGCARLLGADFVFIARVRDQSQGRMEVLASKRGAQEEAHWWFDLPGTPCSLLYADGEPANWAQRRVGGGVCVSEAVAGRFESIRDTAFEAFVGIPLHDARRVLLGHVALFFERRWATAAQRDAVAELAELFAFRVQAELNRCVLEEGREAAIGELERVNRLLLAESITDHLTGLHNRRHFTQRMQQAFAAFQRGQCGYALLVIDLDHFKAINDDHGHDTGDRVLRQVAQALRACCRTGGEPLFRIGGEEFAILCPGELDDPGLQRLGERINSAMRALKVDSVPGLRLSASVGGALPGAGDAGWMDAYRRADAAMYRAKQAGRDCTVLDPVSPPAFALDRME